LDILKNEKVIIILLSVTAVLIGMGVYNKGVFQEEKSFEVSSEPHEIDLVDLAQDGHLMLQFLCI